MVKFDQILFASFFSCFPVVADGGQTAPWLGPPVACERMQ